VNWSGPDQTGDYLAVAAIGATPDQYLGRALTRAGNPASVFTPVEPGDYEVRYVTDNGKKILASTAIRVSSL